MECQSRTAGYRKDRVNLKMQTNRLTCPICAGRADDKFNVAGHSIGACTSCSHQFANINPGKDHAAEQFSDEYFFGGGTSGYQDYLSSAMLIRKGAERYTKIVNRHCKSSSDTAGIRVLDVGCAAGFVMQGFKQSGWIASGIDPNQTMVEESRANGFAARCATLETVFDETSLAKRTEEYFDLISMIQVIAHLSDLTKAASNLRRLLRADGFVLVETWDSASFTAKLLGERWHEYSPPNVLHYFSKNSLDKLFVDAGFNYVAGGRPAKRINLGHARSLFEFKYGNTHWGKPIVKASRVISDDVAIPYPAEDLFWRIYQKTTV